MRVLLSAAILAGTVAGLGGAVVTYRDAAGDRPGASPNASSGRPAAPSQTPAVVIRYRPCEKGWVRRGQACVRVRTKVVVVPAVVPVVTSASPAPALPAFARSAPAGSRPATHRTTHQAAHPAPSVEPGDDGAQAGPAPTDD